MIVSRPDNLVTDPIEPPERATDPKDRVTLREKTALGLGFVASSGSHDVIHVISSSVYNVTMGLNPALVSVLLFVQRFWGALLEPLVGQFSDNFRSHYGRRRPLLAASILPLAVGFALLWLFPHQLSGPSLFAYLLGVSLIFYTARSFYAIPLLGLQVEASTDYHERTRLSGYTGIAFRVFALVSNWIFVFVQSSWFPNPLAGIRFTGWTLGLLFLGAGLAPVFFARERLYSQVARRQPRVPLRESIRTVIGNGPFLRILGAHAFASFGYNVVGIFGMYSLYYYVYRGDIRHAAMMQGWAGAAYQLAGIASIVACRRLSRRFGKRRTLQFAALILMVGSAAKLVLFQPTHAWLVLLAWSANGAGTIGMEIMALSMLADAVDFAEWRTGARREGMYASAFGLGGWLAYSLGALLSGFILVAIGFDAHLGGAQPPETLWEMRVLYAALPFAGALAALLVVHSYPLSESKVEQMKADLEARRLQPA